MLAAYGATGASVGRTAAITAGRLRQLAACDDRAPAVNGGNVRYHGGSVAVAAGTVAVPVELSDCWPPADVSQPLACWLINVRADRDADLHTTHVRRHEM